MFVVGVSKRIEVLLLHLWLPGLVCVVLVFLMKRIRWCL